MFGVTCSYQLSSIYRKSAQKDLKRLHFIQIIKNLIKSIKIDFKIAEKSASLHKDYEGSVIFIQPVCDSPLPPL